MSDTRLQRNDNTFLIRKKEPEGKIYTGSEAMIGLLCKRVAEKLHEHYPKEYWIVGRTRDFSVIYIGLADVSAVFKYVLHTKDVQNDTDLKSVVKAGGEMLERAFLSRNKRGEKKEPTKFDISGCPDRLNAHGKGDIINIKGGLL